MSEACITNTKRPQLKKDSPNFLLSRSTVGLVVSLCCVEPCCCFSVVVHSTTNNYCCCQPHRRNFGETAPRVEITGRCVVWMSRLSD